MKRIMFALCCFVSLLLCGCASTDKENLPLVGKTYKLVSSKGYSATITFNKDKTFNGFSGVNRFFGEFRTAGDNIVFDRMGSTKMAGPPEAMKFEDKFIRALGRATRFYEIGRNLTFFNGDMPLITLKIAE